MPKYKRKRYEEFVEPEPKVEEPKVYKPSGPFKIVFKPASSATSVQMGPFTFERGKAKFFDSDKDLPVKLDELKKMGFEITEGALSTNESIEESTGEIKPRYSKGIVWKGSIKSKITDYGRFKKDELRFDLPEDVVNKLSGQNGFEVVNK